MEVNGAEGSGKCFGPLHKFLKIIQIFWNLFKNKKGPWPKILDKALTSLGFFVLTSSLLSKFRQDQISRSLRSLVQICCQFLLFWFYVGIIFVENFVKIRSVEVPEAMFKCAVSFYYFVILLLLLFLLILNVILIFIILLLSYYDTNRSSASFLILYKFSSCPLKYR